MSDLQARIGRWVVETLGGEAENAGLSPLQNKQERCLRFVEEAIELGQAAGLKRDQLHKLVDYVMNRPIGDPYQEIGGSMLTLYAVAESYEVDANYLCHAEVIRVESPKIREKVRRRQAEKREALQTVALTDQQQKKENT